VRPAVTGRGKARAWWRQREDEGRVGGRQGTVALGGRSGSTGQRGFFREEGQRDVRRRVTG
jgi:hypothetical protein